MTTPIVHFMRLRDVLKTVALGKTTLYRWMDEGRFPRSIELGPGCVRWREDEVESWKAERIEAARQCADGG